MPQTSIPDTDLAAVLRDFERLAAPGDQHSPGLAGLLAGGDEPTALHFRAVLQALPAAVYATDPAGRIIFYNDEAVRLWGCRPELGKSEFCGSWKLYWPDGTPLPHDECPMALALKTRRPIRGMEAVAERPDGTRVPFIPYPTPVFDGAGALIGAVNMLVDITERRRTEQRIRDSEARYRDIFDNVRIAVWEEDFSAVFDMLEELRADGVRDLRAWFRDQPDRLMEAIRRVRLLDINGFAVELFEADHKQTLLRSLADVFLPETEPVFIEELVALWEGRRRFESEAVLRTLRGRRLDVLFTMAFEGARAERTLVGILDISARKKAAQAEVVERRRADQALQRLAAIVESSDDAIVSKDLNGIITTWNRGAEKLFGYTAQEIISRPVTVLIPAGRDDEEPSILARLRRGERIDHYETVRRRKDDTLVDISLSVSPLRDTDGTVIGASKIARDITERRRAQEQQELLVREMSHRVKNLFAVAGSVVALSARDATTPQEMAAALQGRLGALTRAHDLTRPDLIETGAKGRQASLQELVRAILAPYVAAEAASGERVVVGGLDVPVGGNAVTGLALILHEIATNAAKYGALSSPAGRVLVETRRVDDALHLSWVERGGPRLKGPPQGDEGFGGQLVRRIVGGQFGGGISYDWQAEGLIIRLAVPLARLAA